MHPRGSTSKGLGEVVDSKTLTYCGGVPKPSAKVDQGPSFPSLLDCQSADGPRSSRSVVIYQAWLGATTIGATSMLMCNRHGDGRFNSDTMKMGLSGLCGLSLS